MEAIMLFCMLNFYFKHGYSHQCCPARSFTYQVLIIVPWFLVVLLNIFVAILSFLAAKAWRLMVLCSWVYFYWIPWPWKHRCRHQNCAVKNFTYHFLMIVCDFWRPLWNFGGHHEIKGPLLFLVTLLDSMTLKIWV